MHVYESAASGIGYPYVWDQVRGWMDIPLTFDEMAKRYSTVGFRLCCCGPDVKPAEYAPEEDDLPTSRPKYLVDPSGFWDLSAASDREAQPGPAVPVDSDLVHAVDDSFPPAVTAKVPKHKATKEKLQQRQRQRKRRPAARSKFRVHTRCTTASDPSKAPSAT